MANENLQDRLFRHARRPGDLIFAIVFLVFAVLLLLQLTEQTRWAAGRPLFAQPRFWPAVGVIGMSVFGALNLLRSMRAEKVPGRMQELIFWARSLEYVVWFLLYVISVPLAGYFPSTLFFTVLLVWRVGYRGKKALLAAVIFALAIVLIFRVLLQVKIPGGAVYQYFPEGMRAFLMTYM